MTDVKHKSYCMKFYSFGLIRTSQSGTIVNEYIIRVWIDEERATGLRFIYCQGGTGKKELVRYWVIASIIFGLWIGVDNEKSWDTTCLYLGWSIVCNYALCDQIPIAEWKIQIWLGPLRNNCWEIELLKIDEFLCRQMFLKTRWMKDSQMSFGRWM